jgi:undecaprenyl diphosphate synthase
MAAMNAAAEVEPLRHIIVVGGTLAEWATMTDDQWSVRLAELGKVADHVGAAWLTLRPFAGATPNPGVPPRSITVGNCAVVADPEPDGRARVAHAVASLHEEGSEVTEASLAARLNAPAEVDPDLVVVLGSGHRLPTSLVWELAYSELVFVHTPWQHLAAQHLDDAITSYAQRHRRFGGID